MSRSLNPFSVWNIPIASKRVNTIELIQRGSATMAVATTTATISAVDMSKTTLTLLGMNTGVNSLLYFPVIQLTSSTLVQLTRGTTDTATTSLAFEVYTRP